MSKEELNGYLYVKFIESYMYNDELYRKVKKGEYDSYIFNEDFIEILIDFVNDFCESEILDLRKRTEIYDLLLYIGQRAQFENLETKRYYIDKFNELIRKLNTLQDRNVDSFYESQIGVRLNLAGKKITFEECERYKELVQESLGYDFIFLVNHTELVSQEDFDEQLESFVGDNYYFYSLNQLLYEKPELFNDEVFKSRLKKIIKFNRQNKFKILISDIEDKRFVLKQNSKFNRQLKEE